MPYNDDCDPNVNERHVQLGSESENISLSNKEDCYNDIINVTAVEESIVSSFSNDDYLKGNNNLNNIKMLELLPINPNLRCDLKFKGTRSKIINSCKNGKNNYNEVLNDSLALLVSKQTDNIECTVESSFENIELDLEVEVVYTDNSKSNLADNKENINIICNIQEGAIKENRDSVSCSNRKQFKLRSLNDNGLIHCSKETEEPMKRRRGRPRVMFRKTHPCNICHKVFSRKTHLTTHSRIHTDEKPFRCSLCLKRFRDNSVLIKHIRVHTQDKPYSCRVCGKAFTQKGNMERHARQHTNEKPFACSVCTNAFTTKSHLERHFRIHLDEKPFICELCEKSFRQKSHLMRHILIHSKEKPYSCNLCKKRFRQEQHLTRHKMIHIKGLITDILSKQCISNSYSPLTIDKNE